MQRTLLALAGVVLAAGIVWGEVTPARVESLEARVEALETHMVALETKMDLLIKFNMGVLTALGLLLLERAIGLKKGN